jgi:hypothetical protein
MRILQRPQVETSPSETRIGMSTDFDRIALPKQALAIVEEAPAAPDTLVALVFHAEQTW